MVRLNRHRSDRTHGVKKVLAVSSAGGHWVQLTRLLPALEGRELICVTTEAAYAQTVGASRFYTVTAASRWSPQDCLRLAGELLRICAKERPHAVISTGAAPGVFAMAFGSVFRAKTIWVDSIANVDRISMSMRLARPFVRLWLTQWPHLARPHGPRYWGAII